MESVPRLSVHAVRLDLSLSKRKIEPLPAAALAVSLWQTPWEKSIAGPMIEAAAFSPDGTRIVTVSRSQEDKTARIWDVATGTAM
jgi:WD40 repeat protein